MTYYGAHAKDETNLDEINDPFNYSRDNLINDSAFNLNQNDYKSDYVDTEINKELQIVDPITGQTVDSLPTTVKIPTMSGDETDLMTKKLMTEKQKFLGIQKNHFIMLCVALLVILLAAIGGLVASVYLLVSESDTSYDWKIFGTVICAVAIVVVIALFIFILVYSKMRHKKYKEALYKELNNTDSQGNPLKTATLEKMFKHSKPIKAAPPPPRQVKQLPPPKVDQKQVIFSQPVIQPVPQKMALVQKVVKKLVRPNPVIPASLVIPSDQAFRTSPSHIQLVEMKNSSISPSLQVGQAPKLVQVNQMPSNQLVVKR